MRSPTREFPEMTYHELVDALTEDEIKSEEDVQMANSPKMDPNPNPLPQSSSGQTSIWTVEGSQQQLAAPKANEKDQQLIIFTNTSKRSLEVFLIFTIFLTSILALALVVFIYLVNSEHSETRREMCTSPNCLRAASAIMHSMNHSQDPCNNFYNYVCGNFRVEHPMSDPFWQNSWFRIRGSIIERDIRDFIVQPNKDDDPLFVRLARAFFGSCTNYEDMEENGLVTFWDILNNTGLPVNPFLETYTGKNWPESMAKVRRILGFNLLVGMFVLPSITNSSVNQITIATPGQVDSTIPGFNWNYDKSDKLIQKMIDREVDTYKTIWLKQGGKMVEYIIKKAESKKNLETEDEENIQNTMNDILIFMRNLSKLEASSNVTKSITNEVPVEMSFEEMQAYMDEGAPSGKSKIDLKSVVGTIYENYPDIKINFENGTLLVHQKYYFKILSELLDATDDKIIGQYIWWNVLYNLASHINEDLATMKNKFTSKMLGDYPTSTRTIVCLETVSRLMGPAVGYFMTVNTSRVDEILKMMDLMKKEFNNTFSGLYWMDTNTRLASKLKLEQIRPFVGIPSILKSEDIIETMYNIVDIFYRISLQFEKIFVSLDWMDLQTKKKSIAKLFYTGFFVGGGKIRIIRNVTIEDEFHLKNLLKLIKLTNDDIFRSISMENNPDETYFDPFQVNAYYDPASNSIQVPAGMIQFPFYDLGVSSLNYGAIGTIIGHELSHAFDNIGRLYDGKGNVRPWWSEIAIYNFELKTKCFVEEYNNFVLPINATVDGKFTLAENLADDGGVKVAYDAFVSRNKDEPKPPGLDKFSHKQLFFIGFANIWCSETAPSVLLQLLDEDEHSPDSVRVNAVLQNFEPFSEAFNCEAGARMNPDKKCVLWDHPSKKEN